jgi:hypothetical protein
VVGYFRLMELDEDARWRAARYGAGAIVAC